jgi:hypothetical protein
MCRRRRAAGYVTTAQRRSPPHRPPLPAPGLGPGREPLAALVALAALAARLPEPAGPRRCVLGARRGASCPARSVTASPGRHGRARSSARGSCCSARRAVACDLPAAPQPPGARVPSPAAERHAAQQLKRSRRPSRRCLLRSDRPGPVLRITLGGQRATHTRREGGWPARGGGAQIALRGPEISRGLRLPAPAPREFSNFP